MPACGKSDISSSVVRAKHRPKIGVLVETERGSGRSIISGIIRYAQDHGPWEFAYEPGEVTPGMVRRYAHVTGLIVEPKQPGMLKALAKLDKPTVVVTDPDSKGGFPRVVEDNSAVGKMALEYLAELGFERFAYMGSTADWVSKPRWKAFSQAAKGRSVELFRVAGPYSAASIMKPLRLWLSELPKPVGLFTSSTLFARLVLEACADEGISVPDQVAVLTAGHDSILCRLADPPLSSINTGALRMGYVAAQLLDRVLRGEPAGDQPVIVPPVGIEERQSTATTAIRDPDVARAMHIIRDRATEGLSADALLRLMPVCRRTLEMRFQQYLGRTIHQEIVRTRISRVKMLLIETDLDMIDITVRCGLVSASHMSRLFKKHLGLSPQAFRRLYRG